MGRHSAAREHRGTVDFRALMNPPSRAQVRQFRATMRAAARNNPVHEPAPTDERIAIGVLIAVVVLVLGTALAVLFMPLYSWGSVGDKVVATVIIAIVLAVPIGFILRSAHKRGALGAPLRRRLQLTRFAAANGLAYGDGGPGIIFPGAIFERLLKPRVWDLMLGYDQRLVALGTVRYRTLIEQRPWTFLAIQLDRALPHMVLLSRHLKRHIPLAISTSQVLKLEGDFNSTFTLYAPQEYERDALYVFTPDLMAVLVDEVVGIEVEVVDDWVFFYASSPADLIQVTTMGKLFRILDVVGRKAVRQTQRYSDHRSEVENTVAPGGRRLRAGITVGAVVAAIFIVFQIIRLINLLN